MNNIYMVKYNKPKRYLLRKKNNEFIKDLDYIWDETKFLFIWALIIIIFYTLK